MTFGEALDIMRKGKVVARRAWGMFAANSGLAIYRGDFDCIRQVLGNGKWAPIWQYPLDHRDLLAVDWEVVDASPPMSASQ